MCNRHLSIDNQIDHRSYERQGKLKVPTIHEGADARKIEEKYLTGQIRKGSWKVEENQMIKKQNALLQKVIATFGKVSGASEIENATHHEELPPARRTVLCVYGAVRGVGGIDSWGSDVEDDYRINAEKDIHYSFIIR